MIGPRAVRVSFNLAGASIRSCTIASGNCPRCATAPTNCAPGISRQYKKQWQQANFDLKKVECFGQQPDLHIRIEAFFSGVKSLLDLLVQLLSTESIVAAVVDGFHRDQDGYGGRVLKTLRNNAVKAKKETSEKLDALICQHKKAWIDQVILARDLLVHPAKGMHQLMFNLEFAQKNGALVFVKAHPPEIDSKPIHHFAQSTLEQSTAFASAFLKLAHG